MEPHNFRHFDWSLNVKKFVFPTDLPDRPGVNTEGKAIAVRLNQYKVMKWPQKDIYQLDVSRFIGCYIKISS